MKVTQQSRRRIRLQNALFVVLFLGIIGLLAWLTHHYSIEADWTAGNRNTLSEDSRQLLRNIDEPIRFVAFVPDDQGLHQRLRERVRQYQRIKDDVSLEIVNPDLEPQRAQIEGVTRSGQIVIHLGPRSERIDDMGEQTIAHTLQRLARIGERYVAFLEGHGERSPHETTNTGLSQFAEVLQRAGFNLQPLNLVRTPQIPDNIRFLVIASPQTDLHAGEVDIIKDFVAGGGNLLWLQDPGSDKGLAPLAEALGIRLMPGVIVDANTDVLAMLGIEHPAVVPVIDYRVHPVTRDFGPEDLTVFPFSRGIEITGREGWNAQPILVSLSRTWAETGSLDGDIRFEPDKGDVLGPITLGVALTHPRRNPEAAENAPETQQRVVVIGDSDFLANSFVGAGANLDLGNNLFNWLAGDDQLININPKSAPDTRLDLSDNAAIVIGTGFLVILPLGLLAAGIFIWLRRRKL